MSAAPIIPSSGPLATVLALLKGVKRVSGGYQATCPAHEDRVASLSITEGDDGRVLINCHAGCDSRDIVRVLGLQWPDLFPKRESPKEKPPIGRGGGPTLAEYSYYDRDGRTLLFQVLRKANKQFPQRSPNGKGGWQWGLDGVERVLYRLPELIAGVRQGRRIFLVEGEKDVENLRTLGFIATTNPGGAGKWRDSYTEDLRGAVVTILPDNDDPGRKHAHQVAAALLGVAGAVRIVELPDVDKKGDVSDWLELVGNRERAIAELKKLVTAAPVWTPEVAPPAAVTPVVPLHEHYEEPTDLGNARRLVTRHGADLRYLPNIGWVVWDGARWRRDETGEAQRRAKDTVRSILEEAARTKSDARRISLTGWAMKSQNAARLEAMVRLAQTEPELSVRPEQFDADPWLLTVENGTIDLRTGALRPHAREDRMTRLAPVAYDPAAPAAAAAPRFVAFLERIFAGNRDLIAFVQRAAGYMLTGQTSEQVLFFWFGAGANGKSVLMELLRALLGEYAVRADFDTFMERRGDGPRNDLARLAGARLVAASESAEGKKLAENVVKDITGSEVISARFLHKEFFEFRPQFKIVLISNHKPKIAGTDEGIWRRIRMVPFQVTIPEGERDPQLFEKLRAELPGILRWAVEGCLAWQRDGLGAPKEVREATASYRAESDALKAFLDSETVAEAFAVTPSSELYAAYKRWAEENGERAMASRQLGIKLAERGLASKKGGRNGTMRWIGIRLRADSDDPSGGDGPARASSADRLPNAPVAPARSEAMTQQADAAREDHDLFSRPGGTGGSGNGFQLITSCTLHVDDYPISTPVLPVTPASETEKGRDREREEDWSKAAAGDSAPDEDAADRGEAWEPPASLGADEVPL